MRNETNRSADSGAERGEHENGAGRDRYVEYSSEAGTIGMVYDTENEDAWIRSDLLRSFTP